MLNPISEEDRATLHAKFVVPIVVDNMLRDEEPLDDVAEHAMNEILSDLCPDTALLCIGLCASHVAGNTAYLSASKALLVESEKIIEEYGPLWLAHEQDIGNLDYEAVTEQLTYIPEDLESLRDLLEAVISELEEDHCIAAILCDILSAQAEQHRNLAEIELQCMNIQPQKRPAPEIENAGDNVIPFPRAYKAATPMNPEPPHAS